MGRSGASSVTTSSTPTRCAVPPSWPGPWPRTPARTLKGGSKWWRRPCYVAGHGTSPLQEALGSESGSEVAVTAADREVRVIWKELLDRLQRVVVHPGRFLPEARRHVCQADLAHDAVEHNQPSPFRNELAVDVELLPNVFAAVTRIEPHQHIALVTDDLAPPSHCGRVRRISFDH